MTPPPTFARPKLPCDRQADDAAYYRGVLHELIDMAADLARQVHRQATAPDAADGASNDNAVSGAPADATVAFDRIARCVRRSIALARALDEPAKPLTA